MPGFFVEHFHGALSAWHRSSFMDDIRYPTRTWGDAHKAKRFLRRIEVGPSARTDVGWLVDVATLCSHTRRYIQPRLEVSNALAPNVVLSGMAYWRLFSTKNCHAKLDRTRLEAEDFSASRLAAWAEQEWA